MRIFVMDVKMTDFKLEEAKHLDKLGIISYYRGNLQNFCAFLLFQFCGFVVVDPHPLI